MAAELGKFIEIFLTIIVPLGIILWAIGSRFDGLDEEIKELKNRINNLENKKE